MDLLGEDNVMWGSTTRIRMGLGRIRCASLNRNSAPVRSGEAQGHPRQCGQVIRAQVIIAGWGGLKYGHLHRSTR